MMVRDKGSLCLCYRDAGLLSVLLVCCLCTYHVVPTDCAMPCRAAPVLSFILDRPYGVPSRLILFRKAKATNRLYGGTKPRMLTRTADPSSPWRASGGGGDERIGVNIAWLMPRGGIRCVDAHWIATLLLRKIKLDTWILLHIMPVALYHSSSISMIWNSCSFT